MSCFYKLLNQKISLFKKKRYYSLQRKVKIERQVILKCMWNKKKTTEWQKMPIFSFSSWNKIFQLKEKGHEPSWKLFSSKYLFIYYCSSNWSLKNAVHLVSISLNLRFLVCARSYPLYYILLLNRPYSWMKEKFIWPRSS